MGPPPPKLMGIPACSVQAVPTVSESEGCLPGALLTKSTSQEDELNSPSAMKMNQLQMNQLRDRQGSQVSMTKSCDLGQILAMNKLKAPSRTKTSCFTFGDENDSLYLIMGSASRSISSIPSTGTVSSGGVPELMSAWGRPYLLLEEPSSSVAAHVLSAATGVLIFASMIVLVVEPIVSGGADEQSSNDKNMWFFIE